MADETPSASSTRAKKPVRPRAGIQRRTQAEREDFRRKEAEREAERKAADPITKATSRSTRGSSKGGRGGVAVHQTERTQNAATGIFGAGTGLRPEKSKAPVDIGVSEALDENGATKPTPNTSVPSAVQDVETGSGTRARGSAAGGRSSTKKNEEEHIPISDDDQEDQPRRDIERIWISSDEDDEPIITRKGKQRLVSKAPKMSFGLRPVRAARRYSNQPEDEKSGKTTKTNKFDDSNPVIDVDMDEILIEDTVATVKKDPPSSPEVSKRTLKKVDHRVKDPKLLVETAEEKAERLRISGDVEKLREEFLLSHYVSDSDVMIEHGDQEMDIDQVGHGKMFLFQFPPLVPQLFDPLTRSATNVDSGGLDGTQAVQVKAEPEVLTTANDSETVHKEEDKAKLEPPPTVFTSISAISERFPQGLVGKLNVHKSGKVTLDWGGTDMEVRYGTEVDFLQDVICVESCELPDLTDIDTQEESGKAYSLGQVEKKMVLVPDWDVASTHNKQIRTSVLAQIVNKVVGAIAQARKAGKIEVMNKTDALWKS